MKKALAVATLFFFTCAFAPPIASAQPRTSPLTIPVTGAGSGSVFNGTFQLQRFATDPQGQLMATGILSGVVTGATGATTSVMRTISVPAAVTQATCQILHLDLGPLNLNLLGLNVDLSRIVLDITAEAGAGNLLGNLLCAVTNLLNNPSGLARLLNSIIGLLG